MLKGISPLISPELLHQLARMGHGDVLAIVDRNYPAYQSGAPVLTMSGVTVTEAMKAIGALFPADDFIDPCAWRMVPQDDMGYEGESHVEFARELSASHGKQIKVAPVRRFDFYAEAAKAFAVVHTSDDRPYSCFLLAKGVVF